MHGQTSMTDAPSARNRGLTLREASICDMIVEGLTSKQIGQKLSISPRTVDAHARHLLAKYEYSSRRELMRAILSGETE